VTRLEELFSSALKRLPPRPPDGPGRQKEKKRYSELMSQVVAAALAEELRFRGLKGSRPGGDGELGTSGAERRMSGGIGAKKVDVTWATEESGLILAMSVKCITSKDAKTGNFQKNLINRRGDMLGEAVTLHRRFPYAVLGGLMLFHKDAASDGSDQRSSTFVNAHRAMRIFSGRSDSAGRDEQLEQLYLGLVDATAFSSSIKVTHAGDPDTEITLDQAIDRLLKLVAERDPDMYALLGPNGEIDPAPSATPLTLAKMKSSGVIIKGKPPKVKKGKAPKETLSLQTPLLDDDDDDNDDETADVDNEG
jgi:hypothetical protein